MLLTGCGVSQLTSSTKASYSKPDGTKVEYESNRDTVGLDAIFDPSTGAFHIKVEKATTPEMAINAALQQQIIMGKLLEKLIPLLEKGAAVAGRSTIP